MTPSKSKQPVWQLFQVFDVFPDLFRSACPKCRRNMQCQSTNSHTIRTRPHSNCNCLVTQRPCLPTNCSTSNYSTWNMLAFDQLDESFPFCSIAAFRVYGCVWGLTLLTLLTMNKLSELRLALSATCVALQVRRLSHTLGNAKALEGLAQ